MAEVDEALVDELARRRRQLDSVGKAVAQALDEWPESVPPHGVMPAVVVTALAEAHCHIGRLLDWVCGIDS